MSVAKIRVSGASGFPHVCSASSIAIEYASSPVAQPGDPHSDLVVGPLSCRERRNQPFECLERRPIAKEVRDADQQILEQRLRLVGLRAQEPRILAKRIDPVHPHPMRETTPGGRRFVAGKIVTRSGPNVCEDLGDGGVVRRVAWLSFPARWATGCAGRCTQPTARASPRRGGRSRQTPSQSSAGACPRDRLRSDPVRGRHHPVPLSASSPWIRRRPCPRGRCWRTGGPDNLRACGRRCRSELAAPRSA